MLNPNLTSTKFIIAMTLIGCTTALLWNAKLETEHYMLIIGNIVAFYFGMNQAEKHITQEFNSKIIDSKTATSEKVENLDPPNIHGEIGDDIDKRL